MQAVQWMYTNRRRVVWSILSAAVRTCLHEPFIKYEQVTAWVARFLFQTKWRQIIIYYQPPSALDDSMDRRTSRRHYSLVKLQGASQKEPLAELLTQLIRDHL